ASKRARTTALITGASMGIGLELARQFAMHGHDLILVARHRDLLEAVARKFEGEHGISAHVIVADLADPEAPQSLFDEVRAANLEVDFLVNNAGFGLGGEFSDTDIARELDMIQVNIAAVTHLTKLFLPQMLKRRTGRIMQVASIAAFQPGPWMSVYYASKAYLLSFSQALSEELRNSGITVTALCPGPTATNFAETAHMSNSTPFARGLVATAEGVAKYGYAAMMRGERIAITSFRDRLLMQAERIMPRATVTRIVRLLQENR
ncbi:MAG: SDR family oxidoreductase, partial [Gemmatimonadaceae bacterium]